MHNPQLLKQKNYELLPETLKKLCHIYSDGVNWKKINIDQQNQSIHSNQLQSRSMSCCLTFKKFKQTDNLLQSVRNRYKIMAFKKSSMEVKHEHHSSADKFKQQAKTYRSLQKDSSSKLHQTRQHERLQLAQKFLKLRQSITRATKQKKLQIQQFKSKQYTRTKTQTTNNQKKCNEFKQSVKQAKHQQRNKIFLQYQQLKSKLLDHRQNKIKSIINSKSSQLNTLTIITTIKQQQIKQIMNKSSDLRFVNPQTPKKLTSFVKSPTEKTQGDQYNEYIKSRSKSIYFTKSTSDYITLPKIRSTSVQQKFKPLKKTESNL